MSWQCQQCQELAVLIVNSAGQRYCGRTRAPAPSHPGAGPAACCATAGADLPVMVHIHGGGFVIGNGNADDTLLTSAGDEVVVSMNPGSVPLQCRSCIRRGPC